MELRGDGGSIKEGSEDGEEEERVEIPSLESFDLIRLGILTKASLKTYVDQFFLRHHQLFVSSNLVPLCSCISLSLELLITFSTFSLHLSDLSAHGSFVQDT